MIDDFDIHIYLSGFHFHLQEHEHTSWSAYFQTLCIRRDSEIHLTWVRSNSQTFNSKTLDKIGSRDIRVASSYVLTCKYLTEDQSLGFLWDIPRSLAANWIRLPAWSWNKGSRRGAPRVGSIYINAGNVAYSVSTAFTRLDDTKFSTIMYDGKWTWIGSLRYFSTDILHKHHYIWRIIFAICIGSDG